MGVIQQSVNQAVSVAGLAKYLYQQSPGYQKRMQANEELAGYERYEAAKKEIKRQLDYLPEKHVGNEELKVARDRLNEGRANELYSQGRYEDWTRQIVRNARESKNQFGRAANIVEYDEEIAQKANQRAEDTARQIAEQNQRNREIVRQLRGLLPLSQELVARHNERRGLNESK